MEFRDKCPKRSNDVPVEKDYRKYRPQLVADFGHRCGYCSDLDTIRKENFEIDHFVPKEKMVTLKDNDYCNLVYACRSCNNAKRAKWPSGDENISFVGDTGWIDPCSDEYEKQFERTDTGIIVPKTKLGEWMYENLKLGKTQHEYLWNIEQLSILCGEFESKMAANTDNVDFLNKYIDCLQKYKKEIETLFN